MAFYITTLIFSKYPKCDGLKDSKGVLIVFVACKFGTKYLRTKFISFNGSVVLFVLCILSYSVSGYYKIWDAYHSFECTKLSLHKL